MIFGNYTGFGSIGNKKWGLNGRFPFDNLSGFGSIRDCNIDIRKAPVMTGSLAARLAEPCQGRKAAALRRIPWVPRITWLSSVPWVYQKSF